MTNISRIGRRMAMPFVACLALMLSVGCMHDDPAKEMTGLPPNTGFMLRESHGQAGNHKYSVFIPRDYNAAVKDPTIVFLDRGGEQGGDGWNCRTLGLGPEIARRNGSFPFIVIFPQTGGGWCTTASAKIMLAAPPYTRETFSAEQD